MSQLTFDTLVSEIKDLHRVFGTNPVWAEDDADALWSGEQHVFSWQKANGGFKVVALTIRNNRLRSRVVRE